MLSGTNPVKMSLSFRCYLAASSLIRPHYLSQTLEMALERMADLCRSKKIGIMYIVVVLIMFCKGFADALMMRLQQALSVGDSQGFISSAHFQEVFSAHGTTMIFFVAMGSSSAL